jgi:hypothetical protein
LSWLLIDMGKDTARVRMLRKTSPDTPKDLKNFVETAALGCPAARAAVFTLAPKIQYLR